ncbi:uncharacterized protein RAG0_15709 [Rhynchosporium agropyri]|uniref:Uncharacterized protein n=1 Tax=Rhynchosporium agropyri TaxID=914238 RepID=A0A1E1LMD6_9HELO|nr:uncharacterized protein RAG0_15709 [Rhynchosporium agropyri]
MTFVNVQMGHLLLLIKLMPSVSRLAVQSKHRPGSPLA